VRGFTRIEIAVTSTEEEFPDEDDRNHGRHDPGQPDQHLGPGMNCATGRGFLFLFFRFHFLFLSSDSCWKITDPAAPMRGAGAEEDDRRGYNRELVVCVYTKRESRGVSSRTVRITAPWISGATAMTSGETVRGFSRLEGAG
jgi:hypothetical protein